MSKSGFTLVEVLVVLGLVAVIGSLALVASMESYQAYSARDDRALLVSALQKARAQSMHGVCSGSTCSSAQPYGVHIDSDRFIIFQGSPYDPSGVVSSIDRTSAMQWSGSDVVFAPVTGDAAPAVLAATDTAGSALIVRIGDMGQISWSN